MDCRRPDAVLKLARRDHILWGGCGRYNPPNSARSSNKTNSMQHLASRLLSLCTRPTISTTAPAYFAFFASCSMVLFKS